MCVFAVVGFASLVGVAQTLTVDDNDIQSWNDVAITVPVRPKVDLYFPLTFRFTKDVGRFNEGRIGAGLVFKPTKAFSITPIYTFIQVRNSAGRFTTENRLSLAIGYKFPVKAVGLSHRSQIERRFRSSGNTWRYRPSIKIERSLPKGFVPGLKAFVSEEPFYDSASGRFSRNRLSLGVNKILTKAVSLDIFYLRQDDNFSHPGLVHVIGTTWKVQL